MLDLESIRSRLLIAKLVFLKREMQSDGGIGGETLRALSDDVESLCLVRECRELEEGFGTSFTDELLGGAEDVSLRGVREDVREMDREMMLAKCTEKSKLVAQVGKEATWMKLWDSVMDLGPRHIRGLQNLSRVLSSHGRGSKPCPLCEEENLDGLLLDHIIEKHLKDLNLQLTKSELMGKLQSADLNFVCVFHSLYLYS